jgi:uncharacterized membrane protein
MSKFYQNFLSADIIADLILIIAPLNLIRNLQDKSLRRRLTFIFSTSIVTTIVSLAHAALIIKYKGTVKVIVAAFVEVREFKRNAKSH